MYNAWTQNLKTEEEKERFKSALIGAQPVLNRLDQLLSIKETDITRVERTQKAYENPNWPYLQAHRNGYLTAIQAIRNLITISDQENA